MQRGSAGDLTPHGSTLEYWVHDGSGWTEHGQILDDYEVSGLGSRVACDLTTTDAPVFAWTVKDTVAGEPQPRQIVLAR